MMSTKLAQILESSRWAPYKLGALAALPVTAAMLLLWSYNAAIALIWLCLCPFWFGLDVFKKTPLRIMISLALFGGTYAAFLIWISPIGGLRFQI